MYFIDSNIFKNVDKSKKEVQEKIQFLTVARLHWKKGISLTLRALAIVKKRNIELYNEFIYNFGSDFIVFPTGLDFAASLQKIEKLKYEKLSEKEFQKLQIKHNLISRSPNYNFPEHLINSENGIAVFYNINECTGTGRVIKLRVNLI